MLDVAEVCQPTKQKGRADSPDNITGRLALSTLCLQVAPGHPDAPAHTIAPVPALSCALLC